MHATIGGGIVGGRTSEVRRQSELAYGIVQIKLRLGEVRKRREPDQFAGSDLTLRTRLIPTISELLFEVSGREPGFLFKGLAPAVAGVVDVALGFQRVPQVKQGLGEIGALGQGFLVQADGVFVLP